MVEIKLKRALHLPTVGSYFDDQILISVLKRKKVFIFHVESGLGRFVITADSIVEKAKDNFKILLKDFF